MVRLRELFDLIAGSSSTGGLRKKKKKNLDSMRIKLIVRKSYCYFYWAALRCM